MADRMAAEIQIGGIIQRADLEAFHAACCGQGVGLAWDEAMPDELADFIREIPADEPVILRDNEARYGELDELEEFCREHHLSYRRHSDAKYEWAAQIVWWTPGMEDLGHTESDNDGAVLLPAAEISAALQGGSDAEKLAKVAAALAQHVPADIPPLTIID